VAEAYVRLVLSAGMVAVMLNLLLPQESRDRQVVDDLDNGADIESQEDRKEPPVEIVNR
jgi:hypothetical protein